MKTTAIKPPTKDQPRIAPRRSLDASSLEQVAGGAVNERESSAFKGGTIQKG